MAAITSYQVPHLLGVVDYSKSKLLKPDGDTFHLFDPLLLANGQVLNQGATLAPDLTVLEIGKGQSEFSFRGTRFRVTH